MRILKSDYWLLISDDLWVIVAKGSHPFPSRTRKLSPSAPMVLHAQVCGRVGRCPIKLARERVKEEAPVKTGAFSLVAGCRIGPGGRMKRKIRPVHDSRGLHIPQGFLEEMGMDGMLEVVVKGDEILIRAAEDPQVTADRERRRVRMPSGRRLFLD
jgi:hypothetical protein